MDHYRPKVRFSNESDLGGLNLYGLELLAGLGDGTFSVATLPYPSDEMEEVIALKVLYHEKVVFAYRDKTKLVFVKIGGFTNWLEPLALAGISILKAKNVFKYMKAFTRPTEVGVSFHKKGAVDVHIIEDVRGFSDEDLSDFDDNAVEGILDGLFVFDRSLVNVLVESMRPNQDPVKAARQIMRIKNAHELNARVTMGKFVKGDALPSKKKLPGGAMFSTSKANIKDAIQVSDDGIHLFIGQPHGGSNTAMLNIQENLWFNAVPNGVTQLFPNDVLRMLLDDYFEKAFKSLTSGELTERFSDIESVLYSSMKDMDDDQVKDSFSKMMRWSVIEASMRGFDYRTSPTLLDAVARGFSDGMFDRNGHARFPIPNACFKAVKSVSMLKAAGYTPEVEKGHIEYFSELDVWVMRDSDWIEHHLDFGTHDGDDTFVIMSVDLNGDHRILAWRLPMDSYVVFKTKSKGIPYEWSSGETTYSFAMNGSVDTLPKPLSKLIEDGKVEMTGLPSSRRTKVTEDPRPLTKDDVADAIRESRTIKPGLGAWVNALFLYRAVFRCMPEKMLSIISDVVDTTDPEDMEMVMSESAKLVEAVLRSGKPIPAAYWNSPYRVKGFTRIAEELGITPNLSVNGKLDKQQAMVTNAIKKFRDRVRAYAQANHALVDPSIMALFSSDKSELAKATALMKSFRRNVALVNNDITTQHSEDIAEWHSANSVGLPPVRGMMTSEHWVNLYRPIMDTIESLSEGDERDRFVLALYVVAHTVPTTRGAFNDNFIVTSMRDGDTVAAPFPYLMMALRNFGFIADTLEVNQDGMLHAQYRDMRTWSLTCRECENTYHVANPEVLKAFQASDRICKSCR